MFFEYYNSPIGVLKITADREFINAISLVNSSSADNPNELTRFAVMQLKEYFNFQRKSFDLPICLSGTEFQKKVLTELLEIPFGKTVTYSEIARRIGSPYSYRAVGNAVGKNPLLIVVPCHRVTAKDSIGGFSCGIENKMFLMNVESIKF